MIELTNVYNKAEKIVFDADSKYVLMSDVHRGTGKRSDDFAKNKQLYLDVLKKYYKSDYTYIELGDGEELWENKCISEIIKTYLDVYLLFKKFYDKGRLYFIYGNHDKQKQNPKFIKDNLHYYFDSQSNTYKKLFKGIKIHEAIVLHSEDCEGDIVLLHGHQADFFNNKLWYLSRFLVRYMWKHLEHIGVQDPTRTSKVHKKKRAVERRLTEWASANNCMVIAGHTHKPVFSDVAIPSYFNDGSCVGNNGITAIEIQNHRINLIRWYKNEKNGIEREMIAKPVHIKEYFKSQCKNETIFK